MNVNTSSNLVRGKLDNILAMLGAGDHLHAFAAAISLLKEEPDHAGAWVALATAAAYSGERELLDTALEALEPVFGQLMEMPEVVEIFGGLDLLPLIGSARFRKKLEGQLRAAQRRFQDGPPQASGPAEHGASAAALLAQTEREAHEPAVNREYVLVNTMKSSLVATLREGVVYVLGRTPEATVHIAEDFVSRAQCELYICKSRVVVRDLKSRNGTFANGCKVGRRWARLKLGEVLRLGLTNFKVLSRDNLPEALPVVAGKDDENKAIAPGHGGSPGTLATTMVMSEGEVARVEHEAQCLFDRTPLANPLETLVAPNLKGLRG